VILHDGYVESVHGMHFLNVMFVVLYDCLLWNMCLNHVYCLIGSLLNLAKHPASTVQILGAEKALFRAMKTKHDTPKYGLLYHASLIGQSNPKYKGKVGVTDNIHD